MFTCGWNCESGHTRRSWCILFITALVFMACGSIVCCIEILAPVFAGSVLSRILHVLVGVVVGREIRGSCFHWGRGSGFYWCASIHFLVGITCPCGIWWCDLQHQQHTTSASQLPLPCLPAGLTQLPLPLTTAIVVSGAMEHHTTSTPPPPHHHSQVRFITWSWPPCCTSRVRGSNIPACVAIYMNNDYLPFFFFFGREKDFASCTTPARQYTWKLLSGFQCLLL